MYREGFDNARYLTLQTEKIRERLAQFGGKLYLEFGGKLFDDYHASRVLPGFRPDSKINMLLQLKEKAEIVIVVSAAAIEQNKIRADLGITYDMDALRLIVIATDFGDGPALAAPAREEVAEVVEKQKAAPSASEKGAADEDWDSLFKKFFD